MRRPSLCLAIVLGLPVVLDVPWGVSSLRAATTPSAGSEVRVLLLEADQARVDPLQGRLQLRDGSRRLLVALPPAQGLTLVAGGAGVTLEGLPPGSLQPVAGGRELWLEAVTGSAEGTAPTDASIGTEGAEGGLVLQKRSYRGRLQVLLEGGRLRIINHLDLEAYLASVVGSEMPASWPQQALRAQAVAARTYALKERRPAEPFDLRATVASQMYRGIEAETPSTREAVQATRSQVLTYGGDLIQAVFHSSSGAATEDSGAVWSRQLPYLVSVPDFDRTSPVSEWTLSFTGSRLRQLFPEIGGVSRFEVLALSASGRVRQVRVEGPLGQRVYSGADLRRILGLRSTQVRFEPLLPVADASGGAVGESSAVMTVAGIGAASSVSVPVAASAVDPPPLPPLIGSAQSTAPPLRPPDGWLLKGRGFGHGVGMSQWGAYGLASQGLDYVRILQHYYRGTSLITLPGTVQAATGIRSTDVASGSGLDRGRP